MSLKNRETLLVALILGVIVPVYFYQYIDPRVIANATDVQTQQLFWEQFSHEQLQSSPSFATWLPYVNGGIPFGGGLEKIFRPLSFAFFYFCPPNLAMHLDVILHYWLMAFGTYLYGRLIGLSSPAAFLIGLIFSLCTEQVSLMNAGHFGKLNTIAWTPLVFWGVERALQKKRWIYFVVAGTFLSAQLFEGHIQISFYVCLCVGIYFIGRTLSQLIRKEETMQQMSRAYIKGTLMVVVFILLSSFTLAHWFEFKGQSERGEGTPYEFATSWSLPPEELATFIVPNLFGLSRPNYYHPYKIEAYYWGSMPFTQTNDYLGLLPWLLVIIAVIKVRNQYVKIFGFMAISFLILSMGKHTPIYYFFYKYAGFKFFRVPKMNLFMFSFAITAIAGFGVQWLFDQVIEKKEQFFIKKVMWGLVAMVSLLMVLFIIGESNPELWVSKLSHILSGSGQSYSSSLSLMMLRFHNSMKGILIASILLLSLLCWLFIILKVKSKKVFWGGAILLFLLDVTLINIQFMDTIILNGSAYVDRNTAIKFFQENPGRYRVLTAINNPTPTYNVHNKFSMYKIESATGYEAVGMARYSEFQEFLSLEGNLIDLLNVKYVIIGKYDVPGTVGDRAGKYDIVLDEDVKILRNSMVIPRAFPVHQARVVKDNNSILSWLNNPSFDPRRVALLEQDIKLPLSNSPRPEAESNVQITSYKNDEITVQATMADNGFVVLSEKYYPGWKAYLDGKPAKIYQADYVFRAVYVPLGEHKLILSYEPDSYKIGLYITLISSLFVAAFLVRHGVALYRERGNV